MLVNHFNDFYIDLFTNQLFLTLFNNKNPNTYFCSPFALNHTNIALCDFIAKQEIKKDREREGERKSRIKLGLLVTSTIVIDTNTLLITGIERIIN